MKRYLALIAVILFCPAFILNGTNADAQVTINDGATVTVRSTLDVNCLDILVKGGGKLDLQSGTLMDKEVLTVEPGGLFTNTLGTIVTCSGNSLPEVTPEQSFTVAENSPDTTSVGTVSPTDNDAGTTFSNWTIVDGNVDAIFSIDDSSGEIKISDNTKLNYETTISYSLFITVSDGTDDSPAGEVVIDVSNVNDPPVLGSVGNKSINELVQLTFDASATDDDLPDDTLTFSLSGAPAGALIDSSSGAFSWTPTEAQGPTYTFDVVVTDVGAPNLNDFETITVTVTEVNLPPVLNAVGNSPVDEQILFAFTATASDQDLPSNDLSFSLSGTIPFGASITNDGDFTWIPSELQGPGTYTFDVVVMDNGTGNLSDSETITVTVNDVNYPPRFTGTPIITGTPKDGYTLGLTDTETQDVDGDPVTVSYQWAVDDVDIPEAVFESLVVTYGMKGKSISCTITADDNKSGATTYTTTSVLIYKFPWWIFHEAITSKMLRNQE